jgi:hypothetical protein
VSIASCEVDAIPVEGEVQYGTFVHDFNERVLFVQAVDAHSVVVFPRGAEMVALVAKLHLLNGAPFFNGLERKLRLLLPHVVNLNVSILHADSEDQPVRVKLD